MTQYVTTETVENFQAQLRQMLLDGTATKVSPTYSEATAGQNYDCALFHMEVGNEPNDETLYVVFYKIHSKRSEHFARWCRGQVAMFQKVLKGAVSDIPLFPYIQVEPCPVELPALGSATG